MSGAPPLTTDRLRLEPFRLEEVDGLHALWTEPDVRRYLWDDVVIPREQAAEVVASMVDSAAQSGFGMWCLHEREGDGRLIGFCGFRFLPDSTEIELLYGLDRFAWGRGLATEASRAALRYAFGTLRVPRVYAGADAPNAKSFEVMRRLGMVLVPGGLASVPGAVYYVLESGGEP